MSALTRLLFRNEVAVENSNTWSIIQWWESRRFLYNVGGAGALSVLSFTALDLLMGGGHPRFPWQPIAAYAIIANVCYSLGPVVDILVLRRWGSRYQSVGPTLFRYGLAFSIGLSLMPIAVAALMAGAFLFGA